MKSNLGVRGLVLGGLIVALTFVKATPVMATNFYVATDGNDANPGSEAQPFRTINQGAGVLNPGDTLYVKSGAYTEWLDWDQKLSAGLSWSTPITVKAFPGDTVTLRPGPGADFVLRFMGTQYIIIDGLILDGTNVGHQVVKITLGSNHPPAHHIRIQNSEVRNSSKQGIFLTTGADNNEFINLDVHHNGSNDFEHGFYIKSRNNLVESCRIYQNAGWGVHVYNSSNPGEADNNMVIKNKIYDNARVGDRGYGIILGSGSGNKAYNNIIWGNDGGIQVGYNGSSKNQVYNNTIYANKGSNYTYCIFVGDSNDDRVMNNICWENDHDILDNGTNTILEENSTNNPAFVNAAGLNFHLQQGSQAIDAGVGVNGVLDDFDDVSRPQGLAFDIGAYESASTASGTTPAITSPSDGATLSGSSVTFTWQSNGTSVEQYSLSVGSPADYDAYFNQGVGLASSYTVSGIPTDGSDLVVQLWYRVAGAWEHVQSTYTTASGSTPAITSPSDGATLSGSSVTFTWQSNGTSVEQYSLSVGSPADYDAYFNQGVGLASSYTVSGIPTDGSDLVVQLWYRVAGAWEHVQSTYTTASGSTPAITSPSDGATLSGSSVTFTWQSNGTSVEQYSLSVGSPADYDAYFNQGVGLASSYTVSGIPTDGSDLVVQLWYRVAGAWEHVQSTYTTASGSTPAITSPSDGATLSGSSVTFTWQSNGTSVEQYSLSVGSPADYDAYFNQGVGLASSYTVSGIPTDGSDLVVQLWYRVAGAWEHVQSTYTTASGS